jgi:hypothetical protein
VLAAHGRTADAAGIEWKSAVYGKVREEMKVSGGLTTQRRLELGRVSRSSFYRFDAQGRPGTDRDMELRDAIQRIALEWPCYGRPRITAELRRQGWTVNPKRVYRLIAGPLALSSMRIALPRRRRNRPAHFRWHKLPDFVSGVDLPGTCDFPLRVVEHLLPLGQPARGLAGRSEGV